MPRPVDILINTKGNLAAVDAAKKSLEDLHHAFSNITNISLGVGLERGMEALKERIADAVREAIHFSAEMETARYSLAAVLQQFSPGKFRDFNSALGGSAELIDVIRKKANEMGLEFGSALEGYKTTAGALFHGGVTDLQKQVDLVMMLNQAMASIGKTGFIAQRDIADILIGRAQMTGAGREFGISDEETKRAEEAGKLYEYLTEKFGSYAEAGRAAQGTLNSEMNRFHNTVQQLGAELSKPMFEEMHKGIKGVLAEISKPEFKEALRPAAEFAALAAKAFYGLEQIAARNATVLVELAGIFGGLVTVATAWNGIKLVRGLALMTTQWTANTTAIEANTVALNANAAAAGRAAAAGAGAAAASTAGKVATGGAAAGGAAAIGGFGAMGLFSAVGIGLGGAMAADYYGLNPFRNLLRGVYKQATGHDVGSSGRDEERAVARGEKFNQQLGDYQAEMAAITNLKERDALTEKIIKRIAELRDASKDAGWAEQEAIKHSIDGWQVVLTLLERVTEERINLRNASKADAASVEELIGKGAHVSEAAADAGKAVTDAVESGSPEGHRTGLENQLYQARQATGISDFTDTKAVSETLRLKSNRMDEIKAQLQQSDAAADKLKNFDKLSWGERAAYNGNPDALRAQVLTERRRNDAKMRSEVQRKAAAAGIPSGILHTHSAAVSRGLDLMRQAKCAAADNEEHQKGDHNETAILSAPQLHRCSG